MLTFLFLNQETWWINFIGHLHGWHMQVRCSRTIGALQQVEWQCKTGFLFLAPISCPYLNFAGRCIFSWKATWRIIGCNTINSPLLNKPWKRSTLSFPPRRETWGSSWQGKYPLSPSWKETRIKGVVLCLSCLLHLPWILLYHMLRQSSHGLTHRLVPGWRLLQLRVTCSS